MKTSLVKDYTLTFETSGTTALFEDLINEPYSFPDSVTVFQNGITRSFISKKTIEDMRRAGEQTSPQQTQQIIDRLNQIIETMKVELSHTQAEAISLEDVVHIFIMLEDVSREYAYFDFNYWDGVFEKGKFDPKAAENIKLIEGFKNKVRAELGPIYFDADGYMGTLLKRIGSRFSISPEDLRWYLKKEILELFNNGIQTSPKQLAIRKKMFVAWKNER
jgi:hypothetical protein